MRQSQLTKEAEKCDHGYYFGTTCEPCLLADEQDKNAKLVTALEELVPAAEFWFDYIGLDNEAFDYERAKDLIRNAKEALK